MNPALSISALSQVKADVEEGEQARQVVFEAIIRIQNTLNRPDITFDLSAPNDMVIQNQLATFSGGTYPAGVEFVDLQYLYGTGCGQIKRKQ